VKPEEVRALYDRPYAAAYEAKFLESEITTEGAQYELSLLRSFLTPQSKWLDAACGTGYFLRRFPEIDRVGLDISPAMIERAQAANPGIDVVQHDFRRPIPQWRDRFDLVSCMWYAYSLVDTVDELSQVIGNFADWTSPGGRCFMPLSDPSLIAGVQLPYRKTSPYGKLSITGILWCFYEEDGTKVHRHLVAPNVEFIVEQFEVFFEKVDVIRYPGNDPRPAIIASHKRHA